MIDLEIDEFYTHVVEGDIVIGDITKNRVEAFSLDYEKVYHFELGDDFHKCLKEWFPTDDILDFDYEQY